MFRELHQQGQIHRTQSDGTRAEYPPGLVENDPQQIYDRIDSPALTCQAMRELIRERTSLTDADIERRMQEIDIRNGKAAGKLRTLVFECSDGVGTVSRRHLFE